MKIQYFNAPAFLNGTAWLPGSLESVPGGNVVVLPNGRILSVQPDGSFQDRDRNAYGPWELCQVDPSINVLRFNPSVPYAVAYRAA